MCGFGPQQNEKGEWYLSKGVVLEFLEIEKIYSPLDGIVIAVESENTFPPVFFGEQQVNMIVIQFTDSTAMAIYNLKTVSRDPGELISRGQVIGLTGNRGNGEDYIIELSFIKSDAPYGELEINTLLYPDIDNDYQPRYTMEYINPFEILNPDRLNILQERK
nr:M23 family metallopeptidase [Spirochaeta isovalerica]